MLVLDADQDPTWAATELARIGFEQVRGTMTGTAQWEDDGRELASYRTATVGDLLDARAADADLQILDVRDPKEWEAGHMDGSAHRYVPDLESLGLPAGLDRSRPVWVICRSGNRASIAAGILERLGYVPVVVATGGVPDALRELASS
jgi:hydroxyacylglutathione hydrolase